MEGAVYILCAITALGCCLLLFRSYQQKRVPLLLWCGLFFFALSCENVILFVDLILVPDVNLAIVRDSVALAGAAALLNGLIWEVKDT